MSEVVIRRAGPSDVDAIVELLGDAEVEPYLAAVGPHTREELLAEIAAGEADPEAGGRFVIEVGGEPAGTMMFERVNRRSRLAHLRGLAVAPGFRGRKVADEAARLFQRHLFGLGFHRLELEIYAFNERAVAHAERSGFVREGVRRRAYRRHGEWHDSVEFGLLREEWLLREHVARFNAGVRSGDFGPMLAEFADDAELAFEGVPAGPFRGREAIAAAYREQPPDDEVELLGAEERGDGTVAGPYAWRRQPGVAAGEMRLTREGGKITRLVVTFSA